MRDEKRRETEQTEENRGVVFRLSVVAIECRLFSFLLLPPFLFLHDTLEGREGAR